MGLVVALRTGLRRGSDFGLLLLSDNRIAVFIKYYLFRIELKAISSSTVVLGFLIVAVADVVNARDVGIGWLDELAMILLESGVFENRLEEITTDGESRTTTLSQGTSAEMDAAIFAANPCSYDETRTDAHEPSIGMVVGGTRLSAKLGIAHIADIAPQTLRGSARLAHTSLEQLLHEEC